MPRFRSSRSVRLLAAVVAGVAAVALLPAASAQAATASFTLSVRGGYNDTQALGTATGTVTATAGSTQASYSVTLCGQSTYPSSRITLQAGTASITHYVYYSSCETFNGSLTSSYGFSTADVIVYGSTFYPGNQYSTYSRSRTLYF